MVMLSDLKLSVWYDDPPSFFRDVFGQEPYPYQAKVLTEIKDIVMKKRKNIRILMIAAGGTGKTKLLSAISLFITVVIAKKLNDPYSVIIISGSRDQAKNLYEFAKVAFKDNEILLEQVDGEPLQHETKLKDRSLIKAVSKSLKAIQGQHCFSEDTEVLTNNGWKRFYELTNEDTVATLNKEHFVEYQKPISLFYDYIDGNMTLIRNRYVDILCTKDHGLYIKTQWKHWHKKKATLRNFPKRFRMLRTAKWKGKDKEYFILPSFFEPYHKRLYSEKKLHMITWVKWLGYYLSEGSHWFFRGQNRIEIANTDREILDEMEQLTRNLGFKSLRKKDRIRIHNRQLYEYVKKFGNKAWNKYIPHDIKGLDKKYLQAFIETFRKGDGSKRNMEFCLSSKRLIDDISEIGLKLGYCLHFSERPSYRKYFLKNKKYYTIKKTYIVRFSSRVKEIPFSRERGYERKNIRYKGKVFCVSVPNGTLFIKRNNKSVWTGNTDVVIIDEAPLAGDFIIRDSLRIVAQSDKDIIILSGTPINQEMANEPIGELFVEYWEDEDKYPEWKRYHWNSRDCPMIGTEKYLEARKNLPDDMFDVFWEGKPHASSSRRYVIDHSKLKKATKDIPLFHYDPNEGIVTAGLDWGFGTSLTVIIIVQYFYTKEGVLKRRVLYTQSWKTEEMGKIHEQIEEICKKYHVKVTYADGAQKGENNRLANRGLYVEPITFNQNKLEMQTKMRLIFHQEGILIPEEYQDLIQNLRKFTWDKKPGQDYSDAMCLALYKEEDEDTSYYYKII